MGGADDLAHAVSIANADPQEAEQILKKLAHDEELGDEASKVREQSIYKLAELYVTLKRPDDIIALLESIRPFFATIPKARTAKMVRTLIELVGSVDGAVDKEIALCQQWIEWTKTEKRTFLRQRLESRLASLFLTTRQYRNALDIITRLVSEVKRLDDKAMLVEIHLLESRCHHALQNLPKAKAALTSARTCANAIYVPPLLQGSIDVLAGTLHAEEKDYKTAYSYFYEGFENYVSLNDDVQAVLCLKYMLMCKIMTNNPEDVAQIITGKAAVRYHGNQVEAMKAIADAHKKRSLHEFESALARYGDELKNDLVVHSHLAGLYETLLEQNLAKLIEPYSRVQIDHIAALIQLDRSRVEAKLAQMILDEKLNGILDQGSGCLVLHDDVAPTEVYAHTVGTFNSMGSVVDSLFRKTLKLS